MGWESDKQWAGRRCVKPHGRGFGCGPQCCRPGQCSTASSEQIVDIPVRSGGPQDFRPGRGPAASVAENVDFPAGGGPHVLRTGQGFTAFSGPEHTHDAPRRSRRVGGLQSSPPGRRSAAPRGAESCVGRQSRRFTGCIWTLPAAGEYGFIESDSAKAAFGHALVGDISFLIKGSLRLHDWVTFSVGAGPDGLECIYAVFLEEYFRIRFLVRPWIHVTASLRLCGYSDPAIDSLPALRGVLSLVVESTV